MFGGGDHNSGQKKTHTGRQNAEDLGGGVNEEERPSQTRRKSNRNAAPGPGTDDINALPLHRREEREVKKEGGSDVKPNWQRWAELVKGSKNRLTPPGKGA